MSCGHLSAFVDRVESSTDLSLRSQPGEPDLSLPLPGGFVMGHLLATLSFNNRHRNTDEVVCQSFGIFPCHLSLLGDPSFSQDSTGSNLIILSLEQD